MAELSRFFDSTDSDMREYTANEFAEYFALFYSNGVVKTDVYNDQSNSALKPRLASSAPNGKVEVAPGYALINGYWYHNDSTLTVTIPSAPTTSYTRYDRIVLRLDKNSSARNITLQYVRGSTTVPPLVNTGTVVDIPIATLKVAASSSTLLTVTDNRIYVKALYSYDLETLITAMTTVKNDATAKLVALNQEINRLSSGYQSNVSQLQAAADNRYWQLIERIESDFLDEVKQYDGAGSGLDADLLDGQQGTYYLNYNNCTNKPTLASLGGNKIYSGTSAPAAGTGNNGDIYIMVEE